MFEPHRCIAGCGKVITYTFALCSDCEKIYGNRASEWTPWLRFLWNDIARERRRDRRIRYYEVSIDSTKLDFRVSDADENSV